MDQSQGDRSGYHTISGIGHHFGPAGWLCGTNSLDQISTINTIKKKKNLLLEIECTLVIFDYY